MNSENSEAETTKRARFEAKFLRKRFPLFRSTGTARRQDRCFDNRVEKSDQNLTTATPARTTPECESGGSEGKVDKGLDDAALERLATEELLKEAAVAKARADIGGPSEWKKKPKRLNMRFVANSLLQTESQNNRRKKSGASKKE